MAEERLWGEGVKIALVSPFPPPFGGMTVMAETLKKCLESNGQEVIAIDTNRSSRCMMSVPGAIRKGLELLNFLLDLRKAIHADAILIISSSGLFFYFKAVPALVAGRLYGKPVVLDFVGGAVLDKLRTGNRLLVRALRAFDKVIVPTSVFQAAFEQCGIPCEIIPPIVDVGRFSDHKVLMNSPVLLAAKNLESYSGIDVLIRAFAEVKRKYPEARFMIAGQGQQEAALRRLAETLNLREVEFLGNVEYEKMPALFEQTSLFVHGTKYESFGIVLVEALASGTPIVSTDSGGIPDIIQNGINGFLVAYGDHLAMANRICELFEKKETYVSFVRRGLEDSQQYSCLKLAGRLVAVIASAVRRRK